MNLQAVFQVEIDGTFLDFVRERVHSYAQAEMKGKSLRLRENKSVRVLVEDWDARSIKDTQREYLLRL